MAKKNNVATGLQPQASVAEARLGYALKRERLHVVAWYR
jgi:hypothetical protein